MARPPHPLREGLVVGLIAYAGVAVFYAFFDLLAGRGMLFTVNLLGLAVFHRSRLPADAQAALPLDVMAALQYSTLHLVISLAIGVAVTGLVRLAERREVPAPIILVAIIAGFDLTIIVVGMLTISLRPAFPWWSIFGANTLAAVLAAWYLTRRRPAAWPPLMD